jgi:hypothetical protein
MNLFYREAVETADTSDICVRQLFEEGLTVTPAVEKLFSQAGVQEDGHWSIACAKCGQCALLLAGSEQILGTDCTTA